MKNLKIIFLSIILLVILGLWVTKWQFNKPYTAPVKIGIIPSNAIWKGSCQEGFWFELVEVNKEKREYRFRIYNDYNGELELDAIFSVNQNCNEEAPKNKEILSKILTFENNTILFEKGFCDLKVQLPILGGSRARN